MPEQQDNRGDRIRTCDLVLPKHPRYQTAPRPVSEIVIVDLGVHWLLANARQRYSGLTCKETLIL